jgi:hypothetical protein
VETLKKHQVESPMQDGLGLSPYKEEGGAMYSQYSNKVPIETRPNLRNRLYAPNILTEHSSYEREKQKIKEEL